MKRSQYIKLIREYIKLKPEYHKVLDELKDKVSRLGASEEEFEEVISQMVQEKINLNEKNGIKEDAYWHEYYRKAFATAQPAKKLPNIFIRKYAGSIIGIAIILLCSAYFVVGKMIIVRNSSYSLTNNILSTRSSVKGLSTSALPVIYANMQPINPQAAFSYPSSNIQLPASSIPTKEIFGFFPYWMMPVQNKVNINDITAISIFGIGVDGQGNIVTQDSNGNPDPGWQMWQGNKLDSLIKRAKNQNTKVYLTFESFNDANIESLALSAAAQKHFISNAIYMVNERNLNGINIDFEYLGTPTQQVRDGFTRLITNLSLELQHQMPGSDLTVDTYLVSGSEQDIFDLPLLAKSVNAFVIMGYDMHNPLGNPGPVSAMGGETNIIGYVQGYLEQVPADKLILAVPYYGYDWTVDATGNSQGSSTVQILPYAQIAQESKNYQLIWDSTSQTPSYTYTDTNGQKHIVDFENIRSLGIKYDFINEKNLKGVGIWALGYDGNNTNLEKLLIDKFSD